MIVTRSQLKSLVKQDILSRVYLAQNGVPCHRYGDSLAVLPRVSRRKIRRLADAAIRYHDARYNDFFAFALFKILFIYVALPWLIDFAKGIIASGITASIKQKMIDPILDKLIGSGKALLQKRGDEPQTEALCRNIKDGMLQLGAILKREGSFVAGKVTGLASKIAGLFR